MKFLSFKRCQFVFFESNSSWKSCCKWILPFKNNIHQSIGNRIQLYTVFYYAEKMKLEHVASILWTKNSARVTHKDLNFDLIHAEIDFINKLFIIFQKNFSIGTIQCCLHRHVGHTPLWAHSHNLHLRSICLDWNQNGSYKKIPLQQQMSLA